ncbi:hypothetical protein L6452_20279 [Arctium lappa]|uniref:Uncharacterized protein n=1 Tax=Arctium lappa TaxID=4217 RepID=A0ACB9BBG2_ARCLA|nr:hypothetical protein L6452_20279 [Arctium lappa]
MNSKLWLAYVGPMVSLPPVGSLVVYFPQGHNEQGIVEEQYLAKKYFNGFEVVHVGGVEKGNTGVMMVAQLQSSSGAEG